MKGGLSTRMGAALRDAGHHLLQQPNQKKLVLLITNGEPPGIDERDPQYLGDHTKKTVEDLHSVETPVFESQLMGVGRDKP